MNNISDKQWIDSIGNRLHDALSCTDFDIDTKELIVASCQFGLMMEPSLLQQFKDGNGLVESDYFIDLNDDLPREVQGSNWRMRVRSGGIDK